MGEKVDTPIGKDTEFKKFAAVQMLLWIVVAIVVIAGVGVATRFFERPDSGRMVTSGTGVHESETLHATQKAAAPQAAKAQPVGAGHVEPVHNAADVTAGHAETPASSSHTTPAIQTQAPAHSTQPSTEHVAAQKPSPVPAEKPVQHTTTSKAPAHETRSTPAGHAAPSHGTVAAEKFPVVGMAFVNAAIQPMDYELNHRFYGWRPNDIVNVTDNVNNFQLGVLEVTRRTAVILAERISRTGSTASFDPNLQNAMNWFMIKADRYWFPSAESKYEAGLSELRTYFNKLRDGKAVFYTRTDNLIPLLMAYEDLLGSCDENLVKMKEDDGSPVSTFMADDYFFYAKGVASAMLNILEVIQEDFNNIMVTREGGMEVLHHAIESCHHAVAIDPWIILNSDPDSIFANHRSNMAAPISHARFYLGVLIKALST
jgi:hypothetical protein